MNIVHFQKITPTEIVKHRFLFGQQGSFEGGITYNHPFYLWLIKVLIVE
jgi:hypothetical protein